MKNPKPASLSSSLLARLGQAQAAAPPESEQGAEPGAAQPGGSDTAHGMETPSEAEDRGAAPAPPASEPEDTLEEESPSRDAQSRVSLSDWVQRAPSDAERLGQRFERERYAPQVAGQGILRARGFLIVLGVAVLGAALGLWLGGDSRAPAPPGEPVTAAPDMAPAAPSSRDVEIAPLEPATPRPRTDAAPEPSAPPAVTAAQVAASTPESLAGTFAVQLLSARSEDDAAKEWARLSQQHSILLAALAHEISRAEIAGRGTYFRLRVGSFDSASEAGALCTALKSQGQDCLVVKR